MGIYIENIYSSSFVSFFHLILQQAALYNIADRIIETYESKKDERGGKAMEQAETDNETLTSIFQIFTIETVWNDTWKKTLSENLYSEKLHFYFQSERRPQCSDR